MASLLGSSRGWRNNFAKNLAVWRTGDLEVMRYHTIVREQGVEYGLNNNSLALLAQFVMIKNPELSGFFDLRTISHLPKSLVHNIVFAAIVRKGML